MSTRNSTITLRNQLTSPLLLLPVELRNKVYEYVFGSLALRFTHADNKSDTGALDDRISIITRVSNGTWHHDANPLALNLVCRQIHAETKLLPFHLSDFGGDVAPMSFTLPIFFAYPKLIKALTTLHVLFDDNEFFRDSLGRHPLYLQYPGRRLDTFLDMVACLPSLKCLYVEYTGDAGRVEGFGSALAKRIERMVQKRGNHDHDVVVEVIGKGDCRAWGKVPGDLLAGRSSEACASFAAALAAEPV